MLAEIEDRLVKILQDRVKEMPKGNIVLNIEPTKLPAVAISNVGFEFLNLGLAENITEGRIELEESFNCDGIETSYKFKEKPWQGSVQVECPPGTFLAEEKDFVVNYHDGLISFHEVPPKGKKIRAKYLSRKGFVRLKSLKVKATYSIDVLGADRIEADSIAENVVRALLTAEDELAAEGIELKPVSGETLREQEGKKTGRIRLKYMFERELRLKKLAPPIEKIEITGKNI